MGRGFTRPVTIPTPWPSEPTSHVSFNVSYFASGSHLCIVHTAQLEAPMCAALRLDYLYNVTHVTSCFDVYTRNLNRSFFFFFLESIYVHLGVQNPM